MVIKVTLEVIQLLYFVSVLYVTHRRQQREERVVLVLYLYRSADSSFPVMPYAAFKAGVSNLFVFACPTLHG